MYFEYHVLVFVLFFWMIDFAHPKLHTGIPRPLSHENCSYFAPKVYSTKCSMYSYDDHYGCFDEPRIACCGCSDDICYACSHTRNCPKTLGSRCKFDVASSTSSSELFSRFSHFSDPFQRLKVVGITLICTIRWFLIQLYLS